MNPIRGVEHVARRVRDWRHERYIERLSQQCCDAMHVRDRIKARIYWQLMLRAISARSPGQVAHMERRMGAPRA